MLGMPGPLGTIIDLLAVMLGFGAIIFIHELGHFLAARWAGIRVLTFAVGFGPALFSFRRGIGFRKGSTFSAYDKRLRDPALATASDEERNRVVSHTEYRLSALPFGGYVQMLGQDDLDPTAVSKASDSYQQAPVWKRMVVISAGVVMNVILAAILFVVVFMAGLRVEPPVVGTLRADGPAAVAAYQGTDPGITAGLRPGDTILSIDGLAPKRLDAVVLKAAMAKKGRTLPVTIDRDGTRLEFTVTPDKSEATGLLDLGIFPQYSNELVRFRSEIDNTKTATDFARLGLPGLEPGDRITAVSGTPTPTHLDIQTAFESSNGEPLVLTIEPGADRPDATQRITREITARPRAAMQTASALIAPDESTIYDHLLGLVPVLSVAELGDEPSQGLARGDIFARIGSIEFPSFAAGITEVRANAGKQIELQVLRKNTSGRLEQITVIATVSRAGTIGFTPDTTARTGTLLAAPPQSITPLEGDPTPAPAAAWLSRAGARILSINTTPVANFEDIRAALAETAVGSPASITYDFPHAGTGAAQQTADWSLTRSDHETLATLAWESPLHPFYFAPTQTLLKADDPLHAIALGLGETKRTMASVYVTFLRLTQGSLAVKNLKGPVGIAHMGTIVADRGVIWMLFFLGMISVNLAVVNFLPLPIVDGGQFLMLLYEGIRGKPVPVAVQSVVMTAGLLLIATAFLIVTFNDVKGLLGI